MARAACFFLVAALAACSLSGAKVSDPRATDLGELRVSCKHGNRAACRTVAQNDALL